MLTNLDTWRAPNLDVTPMAAKCLLHWFKKSGYLIPWSFKADWLCPTIIISPSKAMLIWGKWQWADTWGNFEQSYYMRAGNFNPVSETARELSSLLILSVIECKYHECYNTYRKKSKNKYKNTLLRNLFSLLDMQFGAFDTFLYIKFKPTSTPLQKHTLFSPLKVKTNW